MDTIKLSDKYDKGEEVVINLITSRVTEEKCWTLENGNHVFSQLRTAERLSVLEVWLGNTCLLIKS